MGEGGVRALQLQGRGKIRRKEKKEEEWGGIKTWE